MTSTQTLLERIRIVLCDTTHSGNMGAAARAMKTMGLSNLRFVTPQTPPDEQAIARATGAKDVLMAAPLDNSLGEAIDSCQLVLGTSNRPRSVRWPTITPAEAAELILANDQYQQVAFLFGKEQYGLTNEQMDRCQYLVQIPANDEFSSLNLASAVQIISYQLRISWLTASNQPQLITNEPVRPADMPASDDEFEGMFNHLTQALSDIEFVDLENPGRVLRRIRAMLQRAELSKNETAIIRGICNAASEKTPRKEKQS